MEDREIDLPGIERDVQQRWQASGTSEASENSTRPPFYSFAMFPYPSGRLHMGHVRNFTLGDVIARFQRLKGRNVLHPTGWDASVLPAENAAISDGVAAATWTRNNVDHMRPQMKRLGFCFDWSRELARCDPGYYHWEQWFFNRMVKRGLTYKKAAWVNWDPVDETALANEQVIDGKSTNLLAIGMVLKDGVRMSIFAGDAADPEQFIDSYGADAVRMAIMFAAPPEQSFEWSDHGVGSASRWLKRLWGTVADHLAAGEVPSIDKQDLTPAQRDLRRMMHRTLLRAGDDYGRRFAFNTAVSATMTLVNEIQKFGDYSPGGRAVAREALEIAVLVLSPIVPHTSHLLWGMLGNGNLEDAGWPEVDESALASSSLELAVQVDGRLRGRIEAHRGISREEAQGLAARVDNVRKHLAGKKVRKVIYVPDRLINFVVS